MKKVGIKVVRGEEWQLEGDLVLKEKKIYMPKNKELRAEIIWLHHDTLVAGHRGRWKTTELVMRNYWWPGVTRDVRRYVDSCDMYQSVMEH